MRFNSRNSLVVVCVFLVRFLMQARRTARAVQHLAEHADENVQKTDSVFDLVENLSRTLNSGWVKLFGAGFAMAKAFKKSKEKEESED